jgi:hypothetical protein
VSIHKSSKCGQSKVKIIIHSSQEASKKKEEESRRKIETRNIPAPELDPDGLQVHELYHGSATAGVETREVVIRQQDPSPESHQVCTPAAAG